MFHGLNYGLLLLHVLMIVLLPSASHATTTTEFTGSKTTVSKLHFARLAAINDFFFPPLACLFL